MSNYPYEILEKLYPHQKKAIDAIDKYIANYNNDKDKSSGLIVMPPGSGKSIVTKAIAAYNKYSNGVLILTNRKILSDYYKQLFLKDEIIQFNTSFAVKSLQEITLRESEYENQSNQKLIITGTIQYLHNALKRDYQIYKEINNRINSIIDLVIFDAEFKDIPDSWLNVLSNLFCPIVYIKSYVQRSDFKKLNVKEEYSYILSLKEFFEEQMQGKIRVVKRKHFKKPVEFAEDILKLINSGEIDLSADKKLLIKCNSFDQIIEIKEYLQYNTQTKVIGIHSKFTNENSNYNNIPRNEESGLIWIYQSMLNDLDRTEFKYLAIFPEAISRRELIQNTFNLVRGLNKDKTIAHLFDHSVKGNYGEIWEDYVNFQQEEDSGSVSISVEDEPEYTYSNIV
ncbi:MAG: hypothetical protein C0597_15735, partial [Marinilabiliales bacterium]